MDEFWRKKDLSISGNCPGGPAVTPGGHSNQVIEPPSGHVVTTSEVPGHVGSPFPSYPPPFDPTVPPPPLPPTITQVAPPPPPPQMISNGGQTDIYSNPPPVIYYPPEPAMTMQSTIMPPAAMIPPLMEDTPEKTQTATNIRYIIVRILNYPKILQSPENSRFSGN